MNSPFPERIASQNFGNCSGGIVRVRIQDHQYVAARDVVGGEHRVGLALAGLAHGLDVLTWICGLDALYFLKRAVLAVTLDER